MRIVCAAQLVPLRDLSARTSDPPEETRAGSASPSIWSIFEDRSSNFILHSGNTFLHLIWRLPIHRETRMTWIRVTVTFNVTFDWDGNWPYRKMEWSRLRSFRIAKVLRSPPPPRMGGLFSTVIRCWFNVVRIYDAVDVYLRGLIDRELFDDSDGKVFASILVRDSIWFERVALKSWSDNAINSANYARRRRRRCLGDGAFMLRWEIHRDAMLINDRAESDSRGGGGGGGGEESTPRSTQWKMLGHFGSNESILGYLAVKGTHIYPDTRENTVQMMIKLS